MAMLLVQPIDVPGYEQVLVCRDRTAGYVGFLAVHSTALGPAVGGTRVYPYSSEEDALTDVLRLARGMSYKNALAGLPLGGGKAVILADLSRVDRTALFTAHGRAVDRLNGVFVTAEDLGTTTADMDIIARETRYVAGRANGGMGDPSPFTARGVFRAMEAASEFVWSTPELAGRRVALQGLGAVGTQLAQQLASAGADLVVSDPDAERVETARRELGASAVDPESIFGVEADILAPCAIGGVLNDRTIGRLRTGVIAGAANNQLLEERHGDALAERKVLYVPDYVANAGGVLSGAVDILGWERAQAEAKIEAIYDTVKDLLERSAREGIPPHRAADRLAEERIRQAG